MLFRRAKRTHAAKPSAVPSRFDSLSLSTDLDETEELLRSIFEGDDTIVFRRFGEKKRYLILFVDGMVNNEIVDLHVVAELEDAAASADLDEIERRVLSINDVKRRTKLIEVFDNMLYGDTALFVDGHAEALVLSTKGFERRSIGESENEKGIKGPQEAFREAFMANLSLIRRKVKNPALKFTFRTVGRVTRTNVIVCYIDGLCEPSLVEELNTRLDEVEVNGILDSNYISELICDSPGSPFRTMGATERPDIVAARLLEGRAALIIDGSPTVLTLPHLLVEYFQSQNDYYRSYWGASVSRVLRYVGFFIAVSAPAVYTAILNFHPELLPTTLLISVARARQGVLIPTFAELTFMLLALEILQEAGLRAPPAIGQSLSIVGGLILGQAAVDARLVSAPVVIVVAVWAVTNMMLPNLRSPIFVVTFGLLVLSSMLGLYGYTLGLCALGVGLSSMRSFGTPYTDFAVPYSMRELRDSVIRASWRRMRQRPIFPKRGGEPSEGD